MSSMASMKQGKQVLNLIDDATVEEVQNLIGNSDLLKMMLGRDLTQVNRRAFEQVLNGSSQVGTPAWALRHDRFNPVEALVYSFRHHNQAAGLGFASERIDALDQTIPTFIWDNPLVTLYIRWTLGDLQRSADAKLAVMRLVFGGDKVYVSENFRTDAEHLYLPEGAPEFQPDVLEWGIIDLGANRDKAPDQVDASTAAGLDVFDATTQHPEHTKSHNGQDIPYQDVPGLRLKVPGKSEPYAPYIYGDSDGGVYVYASWADRADPGYAEPVIVRES